MRVGDHVNIASIWYVKEPLAVATLSVYTISTDWSVNRRVPNAGNTENSITSVGMYRINTRPWNLSL